MSNRESHAIVDVSDLLALPKVLRAIDPAAKKELTRGLRAIGREIADGAKANVRAIPSKGTEGYHLSHDGGIRALVANAIKVRVSGMTVKVVQDKVGYPADAVSRLWELGGKDSRAYWSHPLFGNKEVQIQQQSHNYLMASVLKHEDEIKDAAEKAIMTGLLAAQRAAEMTHG
jgi:hypothetical protein